MSACGPLEREPLRAGGTGPRRRSGLRYLPSLATSRNCHGVRSRHQRACFCRRPDARTCRGSHPARRHNGSIPLPGRPADRLGQRGAIGRCDRDRWVFGNRDNGSYLLRFGWTKIIRHDLVKATSSPDDPALTSYWTARRRSRNRPAGRSRDAPHPHLLPAAHCHRQTGSSYASTCHWTCLSPVR